MDFLTAKYFQIFRLTFQEYLVYRLSFILWRLRNFVSFLALLAFWLAIYQGKDSFLGYQRSQMITYVLGIAFLRGMIFSTRTADLGEMIREGDLSRILLVPLSVFKVFLSRDLADKFLNFFFSILEILAVVKIFNLPVFIPSHISVICLVSFLALLVFFLHFFLSIILSLIAFWTDDIWAVRMLFGVIFLEFFSGAYLPIDILPSWLKSFIYLTPFPYLIYFPMKIWLGQISSFLEIGKIVVLCLFWLILFRFLSLFLWKKGYQVYGAYGG